MTNKIKIIFPVLALGVMLTSTAFAAETTTTTVDKVDAKTTLLAKKTCVLAAKTVQVNAIKSANDVARESKALAKTNRDASLATAKANTDKVAKVAAVKTANMTYKQAIKDTNTTQVAALKKAKADYQAAVKACPVK